jgi:FKBP-type peptidyl-prolyl cis-trans isomerase FkpA
MRSGEISRAWRFAARAPDQDGTMTEITRVPAAAGQGIEDQAVAGRFRGCALGGGVAAAVRPQLVDVQTLHAGTAAIRPRLTSSSSTMSASCRTARSSIRPSAFRPMQGVIPGFAKALAQMKAGGKYLVHIPAKLAYGDHAQGPIPANSDLTFEVEVLNSANRAELEAQQRMMEQIMRQQAAGGAQGAPQGAPQGPDAGAPAGPDGAPQ